ncbi:MAG: indole-3-glycerol phosphate synthase TrpC [Deltaproteobacteria bacterium]|nr:indole-3-glycerol phosphate synthase TrpC [Deltaproteobacteria bacterium]MBW1794498.1 indole-3-glycerol phosphate synthase TrpC [Deltaproteobacteria bacterium]MBW2330479.1 indole-3-glycerol phosphate synthase TrpC [Deltaproteobacteria bacterium]
MILDEIVAKKRCRVDELKRIHSVADLQRPAALAPAPRDFLRALQDGGEPAIIAEIKKASPSAGVIRPDLDVAAIVASYEKGGAAAISVITEEDFFLGKLKYISQARDAGRLPVLCKDFIIDPLQVLSARVAGADALLLVTAVLNRNLLVSLLREARALGMACLVEVHDEDELARVLATDARIIGINNRNLRTFEVDLETTLRLRPLVPADRLVVSESGIHERADLESLAAAGVDAVLVGTSLMRASDPGEKLRELRGRPS